jgi:hypothetical protein
MIEKLTDKKVQLIINNVVRACTDINKLNGTGYKYISLASGFIAHYNLNGFKYAYETSNLRKAILCHQGFNQFKNFRPSDENYEYYTQKAEIYNAIVARIK